MIFMISGDVGAGKTAFFRKVVGGLQSRGLQVAGFASERAFKEGLLAGYDIVEIGSGTRTTWLRRGGAGEGIGPFTIFAAGLAAAAGIIGKTEPSGLLAVDELGPLELAGRGFWTFLKPLLDDPGRSFLFVIRTACLPGFKELFAGGDIRIFHLTDRPSPDEAASEVALHVG